MFHPMTNQVISGSCDSLCCPIPKLLQWWWDCKRLC